MFILQGYLPIVFIFSSRGPVNNREHLPVRLLRYDLIDYSSGVGSWIRTQFFFSMRIRIQGAKPMWIHTNPDPNPGQALELQKVEFYMEHILKVGNKSKNLVHTKVPNKAFKFHAPGSGTAFPIRIRIQDNKINADPDPQQ
jgi:hypothetical protein